jgi:hypothetical protein
MSYRNKLAVLSVLALVSCVFVQPTEEGKKVRLLTAKEVDRCEPLGALTSKVSASFGIIDRAEADVQNEVIINAQNAAAEKRADTIVPKGVMKDGVQTFDMYRCL